MMLQLILHRPEIPPNTGNIIRLCANIGTTLNLVKPLGFDLNDKHLRRAGLDYHEYAAVQVHENWEDCLTTMANRRLFAVSTRGGMRYDNIEYQLEDGFVMGSETSGLPAQILESFPPERRIRLPMLPSSRSLNLSNAAAVIVYEAWRQIGFTGGN